MTLFDSFLSVKILSVLELSWDADTRHANERPYYALSYRVKGNADFIHDNNKIHVNQGDVAFVPAGFDYTLNSTSEHVIVVHFDLLDSQKKEMEVFTPNNKSIISSLFQSMYDTWNNKQVGYQYATTSIFYKILNQMQKQYTEHRLLTTSEKLKYTIEYIHENFTDSSLTVANLAEMAGMSDTYFRKLFVKNFSVTPLNYINNLRISYADELLRTGYYSIEYISEKVGFSDPKYFSTVIKKNMGVPPSKLYNKF